jgi:hypothetical protein
MEEFPGIPISRIQTEKDCAYRGSERRGYGRSPIADLKVRE